MPIYNTPLDLYAASRPATVICIGDSWFWHPLANLTSQLQNRFMNEDILLIGDSGLEASDLVDPSQRFFSMFQTALADYKGTRRMSSSAQAATILRASMILPIS